MTTQELAELLRAEMGRVHDKLDDVKAHTSAIDVTLASQAADLKHHIARTDALEKRVEQVAKSIEPIQTHVTMVRGVGAGLGVLTTVLGAIAAAFKLFGL